LEDAGLKGCAELLDRTDLVVAAGSGERDTAVDCKVLETTGEAGNAPLRANQVLPSALRPTLFLAQLSNLLAGNISIVHHVTGSSRTFMGEETAGLAAIDNAFRRIAAGQSEVCLVGGALNAEREDLLLAYELGRNLWSRPFQPVAQRASGGGGFVPGSVGAFLVLEDRRHAEARSARAYARLAAVETDRGCRGGDPGTNPLSGMLRRLEGMTARGTAAVFSGASGAEPATSAELTILEDMRTRGRIDYVWAYGSLLGHAVEAHFPAGIALAALAAGGRRVSLGLVGEGADELSCVDRTIVTGVGLRRGEGVAVVEPVSRGAPHGV
jgi:3-oxoacyl-[acyl-carrier-protein] synthase II